MSFIREHIVKPATRSPGWRKVRKEHIKNNPFCAGCGRTDGLEVHHIEDYSTCPEKELDPENLITLCDKGTKCHLSIGHLGNWKSINPYVRDDAAIFLDKVQNRRGKTDPILKNETHEPLYCSNPHCKTYGKVPAFEFPGSIINPTLLSEVTFKAFYKTVIVVESIPNWDKSPYLKTLNKEVWFRHALNYANNLDSLPCPECGEMIWGPGHEKK